MRSERLRLVLRFAFLGVIVVLAGSAMADTLKERTPTSGGLLSEGNSSAGGCGGGGTVSGTIDWSRCVGESTYEFARHSACNVGGVVCLPF